MSAAASTSGVWRELVGENPRPVSVIDDHVELPAFLQKLHTRERESSGWLTVCPARHASSGFAVLVNEDTELGRYRFECVDAVDGDACREESRLLELLGIDRNELRLLAGADPPSIVTAEKFAATKEEGAAAIVGDHENVLIAEDSNVMAYGDGGAGKTTLTIDAACHLAAGDDWLTMNITQPVRVLLLENEGPRPLFRKKIARKLESWTGSPLEDRLLLWENPWADFTFADESHRQALASVIREHQVDVVVIGPLTASGMDEAGTLAQTQQFIKLLNAVRLLCGRRVTFVLVHHENKGGTVSGAWEARGDTLLHVQAQGNGRTRLYIQKARWASAQHGTTLHLVWADGESFTVDDKPEVTDDTIADDIREAIRENPGGSWSKIRQHVTGKATEAAKVRDRLLTAGELVNTATRDGYFNLFEADDPAATRSHIGTGQERLTGALPKEDATGSAVPRSRLKGTGERNGTAERESSLDEDWSAEAFA